MTYKTKGVCASHIEFEVDDNKKVHNVRFIGGCSGNTQGIAKLSVGRNIDEIIGLLEGIRCRAGTSCPDQFAQALKQYKAKKQHQ